MNAIEQLSDDPRTCSLGPSARTTRADILVNVSYNSTLSIWTISPDPFQLQHVDDTAFWDLSELLAVYSLPGTLFEIEFIYGPSPLDSQLGPFITLNRQGTNLVGDKRIAKWGCYIYNLYVTEPDKERRKLTIDPQIDNAAPPPFPIGDPTGDPESWRPGAH